MKVFMSWSGARSKAAAELLYVWVKCVVQASQPWISTRGVDRGSLWFTEINNELKDTTFGIICLTRENKDAPWILFEAGALAKGLASSRVCTFLVDLETTDIRDPLAQFNHTLPDKAGLWNLVRTLNLSLESSRLDINILESVFETYWPQFEQKFARIKEDIPETTTVPPREEKDILAEILESTRNMTQRMRSIEIQQKVYHVPIVNPWENSDMTKVTAWGRGDSEEAVMSNGEAVAIIDALKVAFSDNHELMLELTKRYGRTKAVGMMDAYMVYNKDFKKSRKSVPKL